jgi:signal transduction histidine kinase
MNNHKKKKKSVGEINAELLHQIKQWQDAYLGQSHDAALGRLFRGTIHNLNGVTQAFSMQAELLGMMFDQAEVMLRYMLAKTTEPEIETTLIKLQELLARRTCLVGHMEQKVELARTIVRHSSNLSPLENQEKQHETINTVIKEELEFLHADLFFKHKIKKNIFLADNLPSLKNHYIEIHQIIFRLLFNALEAVRESENNPEISITTKLEDEKVKIKIIDSGPGIPPENLPQIFNAFFTTKDNHPGIGLYMVKKLTEDCGGAVNCDSQPGSTCFLLSFPVDNM